MNGSVSAICSTLWDHLESQWTQWWKWFNQVFLLFAVINSSNIWIHQGNNWRCDIPMISIHHVLLSDGTLSSFSCSPSSLRIKYVQSSPDFDSWTSVSVDSNLWLRNKVFRCRSPLSSQVESIQLLFELKIKHLPILLPSSSSSSVLRSRFPCYSKHEDQRFITLRRTLKTHFSGKRERESLEKEAMKIGPRTTNSLKSM